MKTVIGLGEVLWDMLPAGRQLGGAPSNFAYHVSQSGCKGVVVSAVGNDDLGNDIISMLEEKKLQSCLARVDKPTGIVSVELSEDKIPVYDIKRDVAWDYIPFTDELRDLARNADAVCFGTLAQRGPVSRKTIRSFISSMPVDSLKVFDINLRGDFYDAQTIMESLLLSNILKINDEEVVTVGNLFGYETHELPEIATRLLHEYKLQNVILTCGAHGSYVFGKDEVLFYPTPKVEVVDTVGAGDTFTAVFVASLLQGKPLSEAHSDAVKRSAYICTRPGAMHPYKD